MDSDALDKRIGAVLSQLGKDQLEHLVAYCSRKLGKHERNYSITSKELLAAIEGIEHFRCYLYWRQFVLRTDHVAIQWLKNFKEQTGQLARWLERLSAYDFIVQHCPGRKHINADARSRKSTTDKCLAITQNEDDIFAMKVVQEKDRFLSQIIHWVVTDALPNIEQISTFDYEEKLLWARFEELMVVNKLLCLAEKPEIASISKIIPPRHLRQELLIKYHEVSVEDTSASKRLLSNSKNDFTGLA